MPGLVIPMPSTDSGPSPEFAHVLFMDIIGYSLLSAEEQARAVRVLTHIVHDTIEFKQEEAAKGLVPLPTGDGMALVFFRNPHSPLRCACEIAHGLDAETFATTTGTHQDSSGRPSRARMGRAAKLSVRMGIHSGTVNRIVDISERENFTGNGITMAQRVMDCGDAGDILLTRAAAEAASEFDEWRDRLVDLGERKVKHGRPVHVFALVAASSSKAIQDSPGSQKRSRDRASDPRRKVAILYKRNAPHSLHLLDLLYSGLTAAGFDVFIDRHMQVGIEWARELKQQVCSSYAVVPLLSKESIWSEMVEDEVLTAQDAAACQGGIPRILPVRVAYEGPLPDPLHNALGSLQYILWSGQEDDGSLVAALVSALRNEVGRIVYIEPVGGAVPLDSKFYIVRPTDDSFCSAIERRDSTVLLNGARQMGKTSLLTRALHKAQLAGAQCIRTDLQKLSAPELADPENFYRSLANMVADQLDLEEDPVWRVGRSPQANFERFLTRKVLANPDMHVVWAIDEADRLFVCPFGSDVFALLRSWHNERAHDPDGPLSRLTLAIAYATEAHLFISDLNQSPFNIGTRITLKDFTIREVEELNRRYGEPLKSPDEAKRLHSLSNGQPHLTRRALDCIVEQSASLADIERMADSDDGIFGDHLRRMLVALSQDPATLQKVIQFLQGEPFADAAVFYRLRSGGLLAGESVATARLRCELYRRYLARHL